MAYDSNNLSVLAYANGFTLWHYLTSDSAVDTDTNGYFNDASDMLRIGDMIMANLSVDATPEAGIFLVRTKSAGTIDVANLTKIGSTNTD